MPQAPEMELQAVGTRPFLLYQQPNGTWSEDRGWLVHRGRTRCPLSPQSPSSSRSRPLHLSSTRRAETFLWGPAEAARGSDGVGICQELFSQPPGTGSARSWGHLERHGREGQRGREVNSSPKPEDGRLAATDGTH